MIEIFKENWILENLLNSHQIAELENFVLKKAKVKDIHDLGNFIDNCNDNELHNFYVDLTNDKLINLIEENVLKKIQNKFKIVINPFPVKAIRVVTSNFRSQAPWHQDEGSWKHREHLANRNPYTCWLPITANKDNTLQLCLNEIETKDHNLNEFKQKKGEFSEEEVSNNVIIDPIIGNGYIFSCYQPHKAKINLNKKSLRISLDLRFTIN